MNVLKKQFPINNLFDLTFEEYKKYKIWKFNQVVGRLEIVIKNRDFLFYSWLPRQKKYVPFSNKKHFISKVYNEKVFIEENLTNEEIRIKLLERLKVLEKDILLKKYYLDYSQLNNIIEYIDFRSLLKDN